MHGAPFLIRSFSASSQLPARTLRSDMSLVVYQRRAPEEGEAARMSVILRSGSGMPVFEEFCCTHMHWLQRGGSREVK